MSSDRRVVWQAVSLLLAYPDDGLTGRLDLVEGAVAALDPDLRSPLAACVTSLRSVESLAAAAAYVETFDWRRRRTLFLTYYSAGDTRNRGVALLEFADAYRAAGVMPPADELPDHLAVVLEFAATVDEAAGFGLLQRHRPALELLRDGLQRMDSPYAGPIAVLLATLPPATEADLRDAVRIAAAGPPVESVGLDAYPAARGPVVDLGGSIPVREVLR